MWVVIIVVVLWVINNGRQSLTWIGAPGSGIMVGSGDSKIRNDGVGIVVLISIWGDCDAIVEAIHDQSLEVVAKTSNMGGGDIGVSPPVMVSENAAKG